MITSLPNPNEILDFRKLGMEFTFGNLTATAKYNQDGFWEITVLVGKYTHKEDIYRDDVRLTDIAEAMSNALVSAYNNEVRTGNIVPTKESK